MTNYRSQSTGQLSFVSFMLSFAGYIARLATVMIESDDILYKAQYMTGTCLTAILIAQFAMYWKEKKE